MSDTIRAFFAVELPPQARAELVAALETLRPELPQTVRWIPDDNLHLTLKFLGELPGERLPKLVGSVAGKLTSVEPFDAALGGLGAFPDARKARIVWVGVREGQPLLARIARKLDASAGRVGVERERRPFHAHLTIGRLRSPARVPVERLAGPDLTPFLVEEVVLYESRLSPTGATYIPLTRLPLGRSEDPITELAPEF
jgi:2'-5' RNA ligase